MNLRQILKQSKAKAENVRLGKKGVMGGLMNNIIGFGVLVIATAIVGIILANLQATQTTDSIGFNITGFGLTGISNVAQQFGLMGIVIVMVAILALVLGLFAIRQLAGS